MAFWHGFVLLKNGLDTNIDQLSCADDGLKSEDMVEDIEQSEEREMVPNRNNNQNVTG